MERETTTIKHMTSCRPRVHFRWGTMECGERWACDFVNKRPSLLTQLKTEPTAPSVIGDFEVETTRASQSCTCNDFQRV